MDLRSCACAKSIQTKKNNLLIIERHKEAIFWLMLSDVTTPVGIWKI